MRNDEINKLKASIRNLNTRKFGDVGEILLNKIIPSLVKADNLSYDRKDENGKIEIKMSRVIPKTNTITQNNIYDILMSDTNYVYS